MILRRTACYGGKVGTLAPPCFIANQSYGFHRATRKSAVRRRAIVHFIYRASLALAVLRLVIWLA